MPSTLFSPDDISFSAVVERLLEAMAPRLDPHVGSVARTLAEAYAREMATFYAMLEIAHRSGFLDTAEGAALDNVVSVLGIRRARAGRLTGEVELSRGAPAPEDIGIPAGRRVTGVLPDGAPLPLFETLEDTFIRRGATRVTVQVQEVQDASEAAGEALKGAPAVVDPGLITVMPRPVLGVEAVINRAPLRRSGEDETDESLRARAQTALRTGEKGTIDAIAAAVREQGVHEVTVREPPDAPPGVIDVLIGDPDFERDTAGVERVTRAVRGAKAAGIRARLRYARTVFLELAFDVEPADPELDDAGFDRLRDALRRDLSSAVAGLPAGVPVSRRKLEAALFGNPGVRHVGELIVTTYGWGSDAGAPIQDEKSRAFGPARDIWLDPLEKSVIDLEKKPPLIAWRRPSIHRLDLVVSIAATDKRAREDVRTAVRSAVALYTASLAETGDSVRFSVLAKVLQDEAGVVDLLFAALTDKNGLAATLDREADTPIALDAGARVTLGGVEIVGLG